VTRIIKKEEHYYLVTELPIIATEQHFGDFDKFIILFDMLAREAVRKNLRGDALLDAEASIIEFLDTI